MQKFFICKHCGNLCGLVHNAGVTMMCCGEPMEELKANSTDAAKEKHVPHVTVESDTVHVDVGSVQHPMEEKHHISFIYLETEKGGQRKSLKPTEKPEACFKLCNDKPISAFAYCNLHGLHRTEIK